MTQSTAQILDGKATAAAIKAELTERVAALKARGIVPGIATVLLLNFLSFWNAYLYPLILIGPDTAQRTIQVALPTLKVDAGTDYGVLMAGTLFTLLPVYLVYTLLQRQMQRALLSGAVKG